MQEKLTYIPVVFDKSHLVTIGERLYSTNLDLIRELISNAYDADATVVTIQIHPEEIVVEDNGSGMDENLIRQYFTIGSREKRLHDTSPKFGRKRIGEFGIGKFSVLTLAERFAIETRQSGKLFHARLVFDSVEWGRDPDNWRVPCEVLPCNPRDESGTRITITKLKKLLEPPPVVRAIRERLPVGKDDFRVFVNGLEVTAMSIPGKRFPISFETPFGGVSGEIILANLPQTQRNIAEAGLTIRVKNIAVTQSLFGFEVSHAIGLSRLRGFINADFLPITASRDNIIQESDEYRFVYGKIKELLRGVLREARHLALQKENARASEALRSALDKIGRAFKKNPQMFFENSQDPPIGSLASGNANSEEGYVISKAQFVDSGIPLVHKEGASCETLAGQKPRIQRKHAILANRAIVRKMSFRNLGLICRMERFGSDYPPSFREQGVIFINIDHPLYRKQSENPTLLTLFISALLAKEVALEKYPHNSEDAYSLQYQLLTDAFKDVRAL